MCRKSSREAGIALVLTKEKQQIYGVRADQAGSGFFEAAISGASKTEGGLKPPLHYRHGEVWVVGGVQAIKAEAPLPHSTGALASGGRAIFGGISPQVPFLSSARAGREFRRL